MACEIIGGAAIVQQTIIGDGASIGVLETSTTIKAYLVPQALIEADPITYDVSVAVNATLDLSGDRLLDAMTNANVGQSGTLWVQQTGVGGWVLNLDDTQVDVLGTLSNIPSVPVGTVIPIAWSTPDALTFYFWISA